MADVTTVKIVRGMDLVDSIAHSVFADIVSRVEQVNCYKEGIQRIQAAVEWWPITLRHPGFSVYLLCSRSPALRVILCLPVDWK